MSTRAPKSPLVLLSLVGLLSPAAPARADGWSDPEVIVTTHGRLAVGSRLHVVGHTGGNLVHRSSLEDGASGSWSPPAVIAPASGNYPMQYGGLFAQGDTVYLLTAQGDMGPSSQHLDFRKSNDNGATWTPKVQVTGPGQQLRRANIAASDELVHVFGGQSGAGGFGTGLYYFRSTDGGATWEDGVLLHENSDASARLAVDGATLHVAFGMKLAPDTFGGRTHYMRSGDQGAPGSWSQPILIGEGGREARQQIVAANGSVLAMWQREAEVQGGPLPEDRLGYNRSVDGGLTWLGPEILPGDSGVNRNHQQLWMTGEGHVHVAWRHSSAGHSEPTGYMFSPDGGATWLDSEIAIDTSGSNLPHNIVADAQWVHVIAEPPGSGQWGAGTYARRKVPILGAAYCFGDGSAAACPCGNSGAGGAGCANSTGAGATLAASGSASLTAADLVLSGAGLPPSQPGLYFQGETRVNGGAGNPFGDGLLCAGAPVVRLQTVFADGAGRSSTTLDLAATGGVAPGRTRTYQLWYRDAFSSPCGNAFNLTHGLELAWQP